MDNTEGIVSDFLCDPGMRPDRLFESLGVVRDVLSGSAWVSLMTDIPDQLIEGGI